MTDWKPGDRFRLECEGEVGMGAGNSTEGYTRWAKIDGLSPNGVVVSERWLDAHATKIRRSFQFGDLVTFGGGNSRVIVVEDERASGQVTVHQEGNPDNLDVNARNLTLIEPAKDK